MTSEELLQKVRKIEIKTHGLSRNIFAGEYHSQFKGRGMAFSEVREYQPGDDVRAIDWNVTARMNRPYVKIYEEERELTVMLLVDVSGSRNFGTQSQMKRDTMAEVAATLAFSTIENNDKVGVIFFRTRAHRNGHQRSAGVSDQRTEEKVHGVCYQRFHREAYPRQCSTAVHRTPDRAELFTRKRRGANLSYRHRKS